MCFYCLENVKIRLFVPSTLCTALQYKITLWRHISLNGLILSGISVNNNNINCQMNENGRRLYLWSNSRKMTESNLPERIIIDPQL
ncbi:hypothetical protein GDO81_019088 [Engystomops pustulosus]|uniref:Uncharacterized protein n=1 Tax=Engystomops pustulosus TaxID=76066 RepID=A0AAV6YGV5_ENGPU|nr:hypothetical protein GDO81_019088 [Engystomops pustulosus]